MGGITLSGQRFIGCLPAPCACCPSTRLAITMMALVVRLIGRGDTLWTAGKGGDSAGETSKSAISARRCPLQVSARFNGDDAWCNRLPFAPEEARAVREMLPPSIPCVSFDNPPRHELLRALSGCTVFHFAGHGRTDPRDPSFSSLLLSADHGCRVAHLTVRDLQALRLQKAGPPLLAYLSACSAGRIYDDKLVDEDIHLMSACRLAGFCHAIGSLWEVSDLLCVAVARTVYETILKAYLCDASVAQGLHQAMRRLRAEFARRP